MLAIFKRELKSYYYTSIAYIFTGIFLIIAGLIFALNNLANLSSDLPAFLAQLSIILLFLIPVLCMRMFSKEFTDGTYKLLFSSPIKSSHVVIGKYLAAAVVILVSLALSLSFVFIVAVYGKLYIPETILAYLGFTLLALALLAVDMYVSSFSKSTISAIVLAYGINILLWFFDLLARTGSSSLSSIFSFFSLYKRLEAFMLGQLYFSNVLFFVLFILYFCFATIHRLNKIVYGGFKYENR